MNKVTARADPVMAQTLDRAIALHRVDAAGVLMPLAGSSPVMTLLEW